MDPHYLDWDDRPLPFKVYHDLPHISLPQEFPIPTFDALACIRNASPLKQESQIDIAILSQILFFSAGITREMKYDFGTIYMRAASATGALYPIELYLICKNVSGLTAGVYHFCPGDFSLMQLRDGDFRANLAAMAGDNCNIEVAPVTVAFTSLAWRNAWKYKARSYRHWFWDAGVIVANLLAVSNSIGLRTDLVMGFVDSQVNNLLRLEHRKESTIVLAPIMDFSSTFEAMNGISVEHPKHLPALGKPKFLPISKREVEYPEIWRIHEASSLISVEEVMEWFMSRNIYNHAKVRKRELRGVPQDIKDNKPTRDLKTIGLGDTILRRGSTRRFARRTISKDQLSTILYNSTRSFSIDFLVNGESLVEIYFIANAIDDLTQGNYFYDRRHNIFERLVDRQSGIASRNESEYLCLSQQLFGEASVVFFIMTDLNAVLETFGNRGYRACQFEAGVIAGKIYLCSYALGLGASGSTFYDDAVTEFFSLDATEKATMIAVGVGVPAYRSRPGKAQPARFNRGQLLLMSND